MIRAGEMDRINRIQDYRMDGGGVVGALESQGVVRVMLWWVMLWWVVGGVGSGGEKRLKGPKGWAGWWDDGGGIF